MGAWMKEIADTIIVIGCAVIGLYAGAELNCYLEKKEDTLGKFWGAIIVYVIWTIIFSKNLPVTRNGTPGWIQLTLGLVCWLILCYFSADIPEESSEKKPTKEASKKPVVSVRETKTQSVKPVSTTKVPGKSTSASNVTKTPTSYNQGVSYDKLRIKREFLEKVSQLTGKLVESCGAPPWALEQTSYNGNKIRTIFVSNKHIWFFNEEVLGFRHSDGTYDDPWPDTSWVAQNGKVFNYTYMLISYPDDLGIAPLKSYRDSVSGRTISEKEIVGWFTENYIIELRKAYPRLKVNEMKLTSLGENFYYYFIYEVPQKETKSLY